MWNDSEEDIVTRDLHQLIVDEGSDEDSKIEELLFIKILAKIEELQKNTSKSIKNGNTIRPWYTWFGMSADSCFLHMRFIGLFVLVDAPAAYPINGWTGVAALSHVQSTNINPTLHEAYYNWDMTICYTTKLYGGTKEVEEI
ncbi:unnamed protein product [Lactuca saligna]|uniref:Uncharacterized protein n=1 Tax=Lactuca saligna TaxID=75948 RepID=A0AA35YUB5_LACSI|nr:unnamed protein product [Lactuca saligna]